MIFTDLYVVKRLSENKSKSRLEVVSSTESHDLFENILINKRNPHKGGQSLYLVPRPIKYKGTDITDKAITKGSFNISSVYVPNPEIPIAFGDINGTNDAIIFQFNPDTDNGINQVEIFIARGQKHNKRNLYFLYCDGELDHEVEALRKKAVTKNVTKPEKGKGD